MRKKNMKQTARDRRWPELMSLDPNTPESSARMKVLAKQLHDRANHKKMTR
jgi:hypothetical protein